MYMLSDVRPGAAPRRCSAPSARSFEAQVLYDAERLFWGVSGRLVRGGGVVEEVWDIDGPPLVE